MKSVPATEVVARIAATPAVIAATASLQVRTTTEQDGAWVNLDSKTFAIADLVWPVDIVLTPRSEGSAGSYFEVVVDALDSDGKRLVEARALSAFVLREARVLPISLDTCGTNPLGFVCEMQADCDGPDCQTCVANVCKSTPMTMPDLLDPLEPDAGSVAVVQDSGRDAALRDTGIVSQGDAGTADAGPTGCPTGYTADGHGGCSDTDECALHLDDCNEDPDACSNQVGSFVCKCPAGYEGTGQGTGSCMDTDECKNGTAQCDALVVCHNVPGSYMCGTCPSGYTGGAGGTCMDANECLTNNGGCSTSPMATCNNPVGAPNTCTCPAGYMGSGVGAGSCQDTPECLTNNGGCSTSPMATCNNQIGAPPTCTCPSGYTGSGKGDGGCTNTDDCASKPCQNGGTCADGINAYTCSCGASYTGKNCELQICIGKTVMSPPDLVALRPCAIVQGDLLVASSGFSSISASDLPNLVTVTGRLGFSAFVASQNPLLTTVTLPMLQSSGTLEIAGAGEGQLLDMHFPSLTTIGAPGHTGLTLQVVEVSTKVLDLPALTTVNGDTQVGESYYSMVNLCSINLGRVSKVTGTVSITNIPNAAADVWGAVRASSNNGADTYNQLGCCIATSQYQCADFTLSSLPSGSCGVPGGCQ